MKKVLVTGGSGFVGQALVEALLQRGIPCGAVGRRNCPQNLQKRVIWHQGDVSDQAFIEDLIAQGGYDTVFHTAALAGIWGAYEAYYLTNVVGTRNILQSSLEHGVSRVVYTSTPSVVFNRDNICAGDENLPYAKRFLCHYAKTKAEAEKMVLAVDQRCCRTVAIRPHLIWGPGDPHLIPRLVARAKRKQLKRVGKGENLVDITYIDNVVHAHLLAAEELAGGGRCSAKAYFIGQEEPVALWPWIDSLLVKLNFAPLRSSVSFPLAYVAGALLEFLYRLASKSEEPKMTRFLAHQLAKSHYFSHACATRDFNYRPLVSTDEGITRLVTWLNEYEKNKGI